MVTSTNNFQNQSVSREARRSRLYATNKWVMYLHIAPLWNYVVSTLNKPPWKLSLSYQGLACSNYIEPVTQQWRKSAPPILSSSHCEFNGVRSCTHARKTIPMAPIHSFMVPTYIVPELLIQSLFQLFSPVFCKCPIKCVLPSIIFLRTSFSFSLFVSFSSHTFSWACRSLREPQEFLQTFFLCTHLFVK